MDDIIDGSEQSSSDLYNTGSTAELTYFRMLPVEIVTCIFNCLPYEAISSLRGVSRSFDSIARSILNASFFRLGEELDRAMSSVKKMLPKRESQRRNHSLSRVNEVYSALETRYALLSMTFRKHIDEDSCCFIAGKVLDEAFVVLRTLSECVQRREQPRETQELLKDMRDYSSMAMEYFDEQIVPTLRLRDPLSMLYRSRCRYSVSRSSSKALSDRFLPSSLREANPQTFSACVRSMCRTASPASSSLITSPILHSFGDFNTFNDWKRNLDEKIAKHERTIAEQDRVIREQSKAINTIVECLHRISSKVSFNFMKELKAIEEQTRMPIVEGRSTNNSSSNSRSKTRKRKMSSSNVAATLPSSRKGAKEAL